MNKKFTNSHKRIQLEEKITEYELGDLDKVVKQLNDMKTKIPPEALEVWTDISLDHNYGYYDSIDKYLRIDISYWLPMTEEELATKKAETALRSKAAREAAKAKKVNSEEVERKLYEELKKKFEKTDG